MCFDVRICYTHYSIYTFLRGVRVLSGRVVDLRSKGRWLETYWRHYVVSLSKTLYPVLRTGLIQEESKSSHITKYCLLVRKSSTQTQHAASHSTVLPAKSDSYVMFSFQNDQGLIFERSLVY